MTDSVPDVVPTPVRVSTPPRPITVIALVVTLLVLFAVQLLLGATDGSRLARMGASSPKFWTDGHWWTLASSSLLHLNVLHVASNAYFIWVIGPSVALLVGQARMLLVFFVGGITGSLLSHLVAGDGLSAGASGGAWGLMLAQGVLVMVPRLHGFAIRPGAKGALMRLIMLNGLISLVPGVNGLAHVGGGLGGALAVYVSRWGKRVWVPVAGVLALAHAVCLAVAMAVGQPWHDVPLAPLQPFVVGEQLALETPREPVHGDGAVSLGETWWDGWRFDWYVDSSMDSAGSLATFQREYAQPGEPLPCADCNLWRFRSAEADIYLFERDADGFPRITAVAVIFEGRERQEQVQAILEGTRLVSDTAVD